VDEKGQKEQLGRRETDCSIEEGGRVEGVKVRMRR
jgi:hypothetical protein